MTAQLSWRANTRDFGGGAKDRFKYDSLPKEVVKKTFGASTREVDFLNRESSFKAKVITASRTYLGHIRLIYMSDMKLTECPLGGA